MPYSVCARGIFCSPPVKGWEITGGKGPRGGKFCGGGGPRYGCLGGGGEAVEEKLGGSGSGRVRGIDDCDVCCDGALDRDEVSRTEESRDEEVCRDGAVDRDEESRERDGP